VTVTVGRPAGVETDSLAERIAGRLHDQAPGATVEVRYVTVDRASAGPTADTAEASGPNAERGTEGEPSADATGERREARAPALGTTETVA
jgi:hypothetical protein